MEEGKKWTLIDTNTRIISLILVFIFVGIGSIAFLWILYEAIINILSTSTCVILLIIGFIISVLFNIFLLMQLSSK